MKNLLSLIALSFFLNAPAYGVYKSVMADEATGAVVPPALEERLSVIGTPGPQGEIGPQGPAGTNGADGAQGPQGLQGLPGTNGADGAQGPQGPQGLEGPQGLASPSETNGVYVISGASVIQYGTNSVLAMQSLSENDTVFFGDGDFNIGTNSIILPNGVSLFGRGRNKTRLFSGVGSKLPSSAVIPAFFVSKDNGFTSMSIIAPATGLYSYACIWSPIDADTEGLEINDCYAFSRSDCFFFGNTNGPATNLAKVAVVRNSHLASEFDAGVIRLPGEYHFISTVIESLGPNEYQGHLREYGMVVGWNGLPGRIDAYFSGCHIVAKAGQMANVGIVASAPTTTVWLTGCSFDIAGTAGVYQVQATSSSRVFIAGSQIETNLFYTTSGGSIQTDREKIPLGEDDATTLIQDFNFLAYASTVGRDTLRIGNEAEEQEGALEMFNAPGGIYEEIVFGDGGILFNGIPVISGEGEAYDLIDGAEISNPIISNPAFSNSVTFKTGVTNLLLRPDGKTNSVYFDSSSVMYIVADGYTSFCIATNGKIGVGTTPNQYYSITSAGGIYAPSTITGTKFVDNIGAGNWYCDPATQTVLSNLTVYGVTKIKVQSNTNGLTSGDIWNNGGTLAVMP